MSIAVTAISANVAHPRIIEPTPIETLGCVPVMLPIIVTTAITVTCCHTIASIANKADKQIARIAIVFLLSSQRMWIFTAMYPSPGCGLRATKVGRLHIINAMHTHTRLAKLRESVSLLVTDFKDRAWLLGGRAYIMPEDAIWSLNWSAKAKIPAGSVSPPPNSWIRLVVSLLHSQEPAICDTQRLK